MMHPKTKAGIDMDNALSELFKEKLGDASGLKGEFFLFWKGRVALFALFKAIGIEPGDEVIVPAFTCVVVPNAILYLGGIPVYVDIEKGSYAARPDSVESKITPRTKCIICQNTFGLSAYLEEVAILGKKRGIATIEDCTHGYGGFYKGRPNGSYCDAAFFSSQWNKPFSTGLGGYAYSENASICEKIREVMQDLEHPGGREALGLCLMDFARRHLLVPWAYWSLVSLYRFLGKAGLVTGSSSEDEIASPKRPARYYMAMSNAQMRMGIHAIGKFRSLQDRRKKNAAEYTKLLKGLGLNHVPESWFPDHGFLKYPLLVRDRQAFLDFGMQEKIALGEWFSSPLHPVEGDLSAWGFDREAFPVADYCAAHIINLPTEVRDPLKVLAFIRRHAKDII